MPSKPQFYLQLAAETASSLTESLQRWTAFLETSARLYKYPYYEQLLIFAQRPEATACAGYEVWNETMHRFVRRGSKGIALLDSSGDNPRIKYVFDVSDTGGGANDRHGFAVVDGRYVIACTTTFGKVGDHIDFVLDNGRVIHAIMGDEKNQSDDGCTRWGHDGGHSVVEFVVNKKMWYGHLGNDDITRFHPEWKSRVKMGVNLGKNYFDK